MADGTRRLAEYSPPTMKKREHKDTEIIKRRRIIYTELLYVYRYQSI